MKKFLFLIITIFTICLQLSAQNVGINVPAPVESLQVDSTIKVGKSQAIGPATPNRKNRVKFGDGEYVTIGEEINDDKLYLRFGDLILKQSSGSLGSGFVGIGIDSATAGLDVEGSLRFRTGAAAGRVLTSDANGNATWQTNAAGLSLPYSGSSAAAGTSFIVANTNGAANAIAGQSFGSGVGVTGFTSTGKALYASAGSGIGIDAFSNTGTAGVFTSNSGLAIKTVTGNVEINGKIKMIDGTQAAGRVLTTDAAGLASWQALPAGTPAIDFSGRRLVGYLPVPSGSATTVTGWDNVDQRGGNNYQFSSGIYTIPLTGFYQVSASILWNPIPVNCTTFFSLVASGTTVAQTYQPSNNTYGFSTTLSCGRRFVAGDQLTLAVFQNSGSSINLVPNYDGQNISIAFVHP